MTEREVAKSSGGVGPSWSRENGSAAATAAFSPLVKPSLTEFAVTADAMPVDGDRLQLWDVPHNLELLAKRLREFLSGLFLS